MLVLLVAVFTVTTLVNGQGTLNIVNVTGGDPVSSKSMANHPRTSGASVTDAVVDMIADSCIFQEDNLFLRKLAYLETRDGADGNTYAIPNYNGGIWQVDRAMFAATQANTPALQAKYAAIRNVFGINWMSVIWEDLLKPLYSGLAAALYTVVQGTVPTDLEQQGTYAETKYHARNTAFNYTRIIPYIPICPREDDQTIDIVFVLDSTISDADFSRLRDFVVAVVEGLSGDIRVAVYQTGPAHCIENDIRFQNNTSLAQVLNEIRSLRQQPCTGQHGPQDTGRVLTAIMGDAWSHVASRPVSAKMIILVTHQAGSSDQTLAAAESSARSNGISVLTVGVGPQVNNQQLDRLATVPKCRHHLSINSFQDIKFFAQLMRRTICHEPMIATGMVHCRIQECRNVAFPIVSPTTTLITNVTCDDGRVFVTTRMTQPGRGHEDYTSFVEGKTGPNYVTIVNDVGKFIYADFFPIGASDPSCIVTMSTVNGVVGPPVVTVPCNDWTYPTINPCQIANRQTSRFPYDRDSGMFIQCDLLNEMYLTRCPPDAPFYSADCEVCVGGPNSPTISGCHGNTQPVNTPYCGLADNPCTQANILQQNFFFACPVNETMYLQCNTWGHAYVKQCPEHEVWREQGLTCEYHNTDYNPCGSVRGERYYPYPPDNTQFIDCGDHDVPNLKHCQYGLVWNQFAHVCDYPKTTPFAYVSHLTVQVTAQPWTAAAGSLTPDPITGLLTRGNAYPCTVQNIQSDQLYHPYPGHDTQYIQCDPWGDAFVKTCQSGFTYDPQSHTCVDGPVHVDGQLVGR